YAFEHVEGLVLRMGMERWRRLLRQEAFEDRESAVRLGAVDLDRGERSEEPTRLAAVRVDGDRFRSVRHRMTPVERTSITGSAMSRTRTRFPTVRATCLQREREGHRTHAKPRAVRMDSASS